MTRTVWFALICLSGLGAVVAIAATMTPVPVPAPAEQHAGADDGFVLDRSAKTDRLPLVKAQDPASAQVAAQPPADPPIVAPDLLDKAESTPAMPAATTADGDETPRRTTASRTRHHQRWQDANARLAETPPPRRHARRAHPRTEAANDPSKATVNALPCRHDAMGGLMRALNLSPHCGS